MKQMIPVALTLALSAGSADAATTFYDDFAAFSAATQNVAFTVDTFDTAVAAADTITLDSGVVSASAGGNRISSDNRVRDNGVYENAVDGDGTAASVSVTLTFPSAITAVGFDYSGANDFGLAIPIDDGARMVRPEDGNGAGFLGAVTTTPFTTLTFTTASTQPDVFELDNLRFGSETTTPPEVVPVPAALPMLIAAIGGLGMVARRRA